MRRPFGVLVFSVFLAISTGALADETRLSDLVQDLGSADWATRESASRELEEMGGAARSAVEEASRSDDPEVRWRAGRILRRWSPEEVQTPLPHCRWDGSGWSGPEILIPSPIIIEPRDIEWGFEIPIEPQENR
ncbi:MAG: hypothetical protein HY720_16835 [Planctomycetes bacterium]|nr:hypothetical protein [Planctomycetota bacterium]